MDTISSGSRDERELHCIRAAERDGSSQEGYHRNVPVLIGTSGWQYRHWKTVYYPKAVPQRVWLEHHASMFQTVEVNNAFYRLPERRVFEQWAVRTPADYVITVKASRFLSHIKRLKDPQEPVQRLMDRVAGLGDKLGAVLLQLPPTMAADVARLDETLE